MLPAAKVWDIENGFEDNIEQDSLIVVAFVVVDISFSGVVADDDANLFIVVVVIEILLLLCYC